MEARGEGEKEERIVEWRSEEKKIGKISYSSIPDSRHHIKESQLITMDETTHPNSKSPLAISTAIARIGAQRMVLVSRGEVVRIILVIHVVDILLGMVLRDLSPSLLVLASFQIPTEASDRSILGDGVADWLACTTTWST